MLVQVFAVQGKFAGPVSAIVKDFSGIAAFEVLARVAVSTIKESTSCIDYELIILAVSIVRVKDQFYTVVQPDIAVATLMVLDEFAQIFFVTYHGNVNLSIQMPDVGFGFTFGLSLNPAAGSMIELLRAVSLGPDPVGRIAVDYRRLRQKRNLNQASVLPG